MTPEEIRLAVAAGGRTPYGDGFWEVAGHGIAADLLAQVDTLRAERDRLVAGLTEALARWIGTSFENEATETDAAIRRCDLACELFDELAALRRTPE